MLIRRWCNIFSFSFLLLMFHLCSCDRLNAGVVKEVPAMPIEEAYKKFLNLAPPSSITGLQGQAQAVIPETFSLGYFTYYAEPEYWEILSNHKDFIWEGAFNDSVFPLRCNSSEFVKDFSSWTKEKILLKGKQCYKATIYPYVHYFIYEKKSKKVFHFVTGMR